MYRIGLSLLLLTFTLFSLTMVSAQQNESISRPMVSIGKLEASAKARVSAKPRVALPSELNDTGGDDSFEPAGSGRTPNYALALAEIPNAPKAFAQLFKTMVYGGTVAPETKAAMGLRIAQVNNSPYVAAHSMRLLKASERGAAMFECIKNDKLNDLTAADQTAQRYAELLTRDIHGITDPEFGRARASFNDSQIIELTMVVCFFNYFTRYAEALNLPVEQWALDSNIKPVIPSKGKSRLTEARVALISDEEMSAVVATSEAAKNNSAQASGLGLGIANSQRAMMRVPDLQTAWRNYGSAVRANSKIGREIQLHVSFAVSMANGCRYCTLHQVLGLRRLGVDPAKLQAMKKDDSALTVRERMAASFARKLTAKPDSITDADYAELRNEFGSYGALEIVLQTGAFSFMNRFTDNLRLPSEDEAIRVYKEVYGSN